MYRNLLVGLDGSTHGECAARIAAKLSERLKARLTGLHVIDAWLLRRSLIHDLNGMLGIESQMHMGPQVEEFLRERADLVVGEFESLCRSESISWESRIRTGVIVDEMVGMARENDLLILGSRGLSHQMGQPWNGQNIPLQVLKKANMPTLVVAENRDALHKLTIAFDGSHGAFAALREGARLAEALDLQMEVLFIHGLLSQQEDRDPLELASHYLKPYDIKANFMRRKGSVEEVILKHMEKAEDATLLLGNSGKSRFKDTVLGTLPERFLRDTCDFNLLLCP